jgi:DNA sulfur modification protein DndD
MIIKKIIIENYLSYFDIKEFELSDGLNIILGENGEGKTKFFEALDWLFNGKNFKLESLVSAKALWQAAINEKFKVRVAVTVEQYEERKTITKSFLVKKTGEGECDISNYSIDGVEENKAGERSQVDGQSLLDRVFPFEVRRYSMFKGESELNIFDNKEALMTLVNSFSSAKHYEKYVGKGAFLRERAEKAVDEAARSDTKNQQEYRRLESEIIKLLQDKEKVLAFMNSSEDQIKKTEANIQEAEKYVSNAEALETINGRIKRVEEQIQKTSNQIQEDFTQFLFDDNWILVGFEGIHREFASKVAEASSRKRTLQSQYDKQKGINEGKRQLTQELFNDAIPLPEGVPSRAHMQEMLKDELCKICNRPAKKGSDPYKFMLKRLEQYLQTQQPKKSKGTDDLFLFKFDFTNRLFNLSANHEDNLVRLRKTRNSITELFEFNRDRKKELEELEEKLAKEQEERDKIVGSSSIGEERLTNVLKSYNVWQRDLKGHSRDLADHKRDFDEIEGQLKKRREEKDNIDMKTANNFLIKTRGILRDIEQIFKDTKERKFDEFIQLLQDKANHIFAEINVDAFTGNIIFVKKEIAGKTTVNIELQEEDGNIIHRPNQSLSTSMHISILFAISELARQTREENFPMIFDAPTSSFGETKTTRFLNLIYDTGNQKILLIKDFLEMNTKTKKLSVKKEFEQVKRAKAFWIYLERPFESKNLKTLNTQIVTL